MASGRQKSRVSGYRNIIKVCRFVIGYWFQFGRSEDIKGDNLIMKLSKYSIGVGDRFHRQGKAQLKAVMKAKEDGVNVTPVWNKSHREHTIVGTTQAATRREAEEAVKSCGWEGSYYVDADHIGLNNADEFMESSDFFTLDVADYISRSAEPAHIKEFAGRYEKYVGEIKPAGVNKAFNVSRGDLENIAAKYLLAIEEAGKIFRHIKKSKQGADFIPEVSMDETDAPQSPMELFFILGAIADEGIDCRTIAPKFCGRFNKGVDYVGKVVEFERQFREDIAAIELAKKEFGLPEELKLSVHSGSDKFSIYGPIHDALGEFDVGVHIKTAGTTWLEELIGLAEAGGGGLELAKEIYCEAVGRLDELCEPYRAVVDIDEGELPSAGEVKGWSSEQYVCSLRHNQSSDNFNRSFRQLLHVGYKVAGEMGKRYLDAVDECEEVIGLNVTENIYARHIRPIFLGS